MGERVDIVDEAGNVLRQATKIDAHKHGWLHKTVIGCMPADDGQRLVRQATGRQDARQLVAPVGGHVQADELDEDALHREASEEIGTRNITYKKMGQAILRRQVLGRDENHLFIVYEIATDDPLVPGDEIESVETLTAEELRRGLAENPADFGDAYCFVLENFYPEYLPEHWTMQRN